MPTTNIYIYIYSAVKRSWLIASKIKIIVYIIYMCVLCIFILYIIYIVLHVCSIFVWMMIKIQWLPLIWNGKSLILFIWRYLFYLCYLFDLGLVLKFLFSFAIYIYIIFTIYYLADENTSNENQQKSNDMQVLYLYIIIVLYFNLTKKCTTFSPSNNKRTHLIYNWS